jgi:hypothetical protein
MDRSIFVGLYRLVPKAIKALTIVRPDTVIRWHRAGFRSYWRWKIPERLRPTNCTVGNSPADPRDEHRRATGPSMKRLVISEYGLAEPAQRLPREIDKRDLSSFVRHHGSSSSISRGRSISARATARLTLTIGANQPTNCVPIRAEPSSLASLRTCAWSSVSTRTRRCSETGMSG